MRLTTLLATAVFLGTALSTLATAASAEPDSDADFGILGECSPKIDALCTFYQGPKDPAYSYFCAGVWIEVTGVHNPLGTNCWGWYYHA
jgi:hypothetical protein